MKLSQIKELLSKISTWPWKNRYPYNAITDEKLLFIVGCNSCNSKNKEDLDFIAKAPAIIDQLIRQNEVMREALHKIEGENWREPDSTYTIKIINEAIQEVERIEDGS
jgi:hypothetical protein